ncbi:hypothetical protein PBAL39_09931 [Pedobacter sp. BAL39]|uniref:hypothetical protein n=1 Tax=Pedobacter sp. BAL39 TaxID=391596 RepID=UPI000155A1E6|nr:hypothetical protein [Pedobacter sp. BAL39]EDM37454.1 hypothetical protein PBAL39_09931 [Pedobacter sp. BAL39]
MQDKLEFKKIREFGEIINDTFLFLKQNFKPLIKVFFALCGFFLVGSAISTIIYTINAQDALRSPRTSPFAQLSQIFNLNYLLVIIFSTANYVAIYVSVLSYVAVYIEKGNVIPSLEEVWAYFKYYFFRALGSGLLMGLFFFVALMMCIIPGIYVFPALCIFLPVMVYENGGFSYSFSRSFKLLKNQWFPTAGVILILYVMTYACMSIVSAPALIFTMTSQFLQFEKTTLNWLLAGSTVLQYLCQVFMILPVIGFSLTYFSLVERLDSDGLMQRIGQLGEDKQAFKAPEEY